MSNIVTSDLPKKPRGGSQTGYNPAILVMDVQRILTERGVLFSTVEHPSQGAIMMAADLLHCLGVTPESAPVRQPLS